jgi:hypothetical protein
MFDVFLSFTRTGHPELARRAHDLLTRAGYTVFVDRQVPVGDSISDEIVAAIRASRLMVVIYSASYSHRWACQWELVQAYLTGATEGDPSRRLLIVNPEQGHRHIVPAVVADSMFLRASDLDRLPAEVARKLAAVRDPMAAVRQTDPPRWLPATVAGTPSFVGRFPDLWRVHDLLTGADRPLTIKAYSAPAVVITGMAGIGKTSLARAYAWLFGEAYPAGIYWIAVGGAGGVDTAQAWFAEQVRELADLVGIPTAGASAGRVALLLGEYLDRQPGPALWVVDDLPADLDWTTLGHFVIPARRLRATFLMRRFAASDAAGHLSLTGLDEHDALAVLTAARPMSAHDRPAAMSIVQRVGGHPLALRSVAARLANGVFSYADCAAMPTAENTDTAVLAAIGMSMDTLSTRERTAITLAGVLAPAPIPVTALTRLLAAVDPVRARHPGRDRRRAYRTAPARSCPPGRRRRGLADPPVGGRGTGRSRRAGDHARPGRVHRRTRGVPATRRCRPAPARDRLVGPARRCPRRLHIPDRRAEFYPAPARGAPPRTRR